MMNSLQIGWPRSELRRFMFTLLAGLICLALAMRAEPAQAQSPLDGFAPDVNGEVHAVAVQPDGKVLVGGAFTQVGENLRNRLARFDLSGAYDSSLDANINGTVRVLAVQQNGQILVGGDFTRAGGADRSHLARLNAGGGAETSFNPAPDAAVHALLLLDDGSLLVAGEFTAIGGAGQRYLARLDSTGALDATFAPAVNGAVYALAMQRDGSIVIGGAFTEVAGEPRSHIARLGADGALDAGFAPDANAVVRAVAIGFGDAIIAGGEFTQIGGAARSRFALLTASGAPAAATPAFDAAVHTVLVQADGRIVVGGAFGQVDGQARRALARVASSGALDAGFAPNPDAAVHTLALQADDKIVAGGAFLTVGAAPRTRVARFYEIGSLDADFAPAAINSADDDVIAVAVQPDGKIVAGGSFTSFSGQPRLHLARFFPDGALDMSFAPSANNDVRALVIQPDGKIIVGGSFTQLNGQDYPFIARLEANGALDSGFARFGDGSVLKVLAVALQADGKIVVAIEPRNADSTQPRLVRLNGDGVIDTTFQNTIDNYQVSSLAIQPDGRIIACGDFELVGESGAEIFYMARVEKDGRLDETYTPNLARCFAVIIQPDGRAVAGTNLPNPQRFNLDGSTDTSFAPNIPDGYVFGLARQADGKLVVVNNFTEGVQNRSRILRLDDNGAADPQFGARIADDTVFGVALQKDGKIVIGGGFTSVQDPNGAPQPRSLLARLSATTIARQTWRVAGSGSALSWQAEGAFPDFVAADFAYSTDGVVFTALGAGVRAATGWQLGGVGLPFNREFLVRVRGESISGGFNTSAGRIDSIARSFIAGGSIEVATLVSPTQIAPQWAVDVSGNSAFSDTLVGAGTTGVREVGLGVYTVTLRAVSETVQTDYVVSHMCTVDGEAGSSGEGNTVQATVAAESAVRCLFTTVRRTGAIEVRHVISPTASVTWDLRITGPALYTATLTGDATSGEQIIFTGVYTVDLVQRGSASYITTYQCTAAGQPLVSGEGAQATLTVAEGQSIVCDFRSELDAPPNQLFLPVVVR